MGLIHSLLNTQCVTVREIIVFRDREKEMQTEKEGSDGIIVELIEVRLSDKVGKDKRCCF